MVVERGDAVNTQAPDDGEAGAVNDGKVLVSPGEADLPSHF